MTDIMRKHNRMILISVLFATATAISACATAPHRKAPADESYNHHGAKFLRFVQDSYLENGGEAREFFDWMEKNYSKYAAKQSGGGNKTLNDYIRKNTEALKKASRPADKAHIEMEIGAKTHRMIKSVIPLFSLDRGFEFRNVVRYGERQCFLQSVLIAGLLQEMGIRAGVVMVYKNIGGEESNNGHAVALLKLADGRDIIVDASDPEPFAMQQGLFVRDKSYLYVLPQYDKKTGAIVGYKRTSDGAPVPVSRVRTLDINFLRSQFYYYRGERTPGGPLLKPHMPEGLKTAGLFLEKGIRHCPGNPQVVYMLGRVYYEQGDTVKARKYLKRSLELYQKYGWSPAGPKEFLDLAQKK